MLVPERVRMRVHATSVNPALPHLSAVPVFATDMASYCFKRGEMTGLGHGRLPEYWSVNGLPLFWCGCCSGHEIRTSSHGVYANHSRDGTAHRSHTTLPLPASVPRPGHLHSSSG